MRARWIGVTGCALVLGFTLVLFRGEPRATSDQGVFLSVAARMLDGDHLYSEVIDNKDPLFFYTYAGALWVGSWRAPFALDGIWLALAAVSFALLLRELRAPRPAVVAGFFMYPLSLTSGWYEPGFSMLAALAVAPLTGWLWLRRSYGAAGAVFGAAMLFKLNLAPVVVAPIAAFVLLGAPSGSRGRHIVRAAYGLTALIGAAAALLVARGELVAYLDVPAYNVYYSKASLQADGTFDAIVGHLRVVREYLLAAGKWQAPATVVVLGVFFAAVSIGWRRGGQRFQLLTAAAISTCIATLGTLALTAIWAHHLQVLAYPAVLVAATIISAASASFGQRAGVVAAGACVIFAFWSSAKVEVQSGLSAGAWFSDPVSVSADALEDARLRFYDGSERVSYMVFGGNSENAHAAFISDAFALTCRWFHLYPFSQEEQFSETLDCAEEEKPELILVTLGFFDDRSATRDWGSFVSRARHVLESRYQMVSDTYPGFQVWKRRPLLSRA